MKWFLCLFIQMCRSKAYKSSSPLYFLHVPFKFDWPVKKSLHFCSYLNAQFTKHFRMSSLQTLKTEPEEMHMCENFESSLSRKPDNFKNFLHGFLTLPSSLHPYYEISWRKWKLSGESYKSRHCFDFCHHRMLEASKRETYTPETRSDISSSVKTQTVPMWTASKTKQKKIQNWIHHSNLRSLLIWKHPFITWTQVIWTQISYNTQSNPYTNKWYHQMHHNTNSCPKSASFTVCFKGEILSTELA